MEGSVSHAGEHKPTQKLQIFVKTFTTNVDFVSYLERNVYFTYSVPITYQCSTSQISIFQLYDNCLIFDITMLLIAQHGSFTELDVSYIFR
jgi:hypothetical protein